MVGLDVFLVIVLPVELLVFFLEESHHCLLVLEIDEVDDLIVVLFERL